MSELLNLWLFAYAIGKVLVITGIGPALLIALCWRVRVVKIGFEQVRGGQLVHLENRTSEPWATSPPRKEKAA